MGYSLHSQHAQKSNLPKTTTPIQSLHQLNLSVLNEWNSTRLTSTKILPTPISAIPSQLLCLLTCQRLWWECPDLCKMSSLLADDCQLSHSLQLDPRGQIEPLGHCKDLKVVTLNWNRDSKKWKCAKRETANVAQNTEGKCWAFRKRTAPFSS